MIRDLGVGHNGERRPKATIDLQEPRNSLGKVKLRDVSVFKF